MYQVSNGTHVGRPRPDSLHDWAETRLLQQFAMLRVQLALLPKLGNHGLTCSYVIDSTCRWICSSRNFTLGCVNGYTSSACCHHQRRISAPPYRVVQAHLNIAQAVDEEDIPFPIPSTTFAHIGHPLTHFYSGFDSFLE